MHLKLGKCAAKFCYHHSHTVFCDFHASAAPAYIHQLFLRQHLALCFRHGGEAQAGALGERDVGFPVRAGKRARLKIQRHACSNRDVIEHSYLILLV